MKDDDIKKWIGKVRYDDHGQLIFREPEKNNLKQFLDLRGWGSLTSSGMSPEEAARFQDRVGEWVVKTINEALSKDSSTITLNLTDDDHRTTIKDK